MAEFQISYRAPARFDEMLEIALTVTDIGRSSLRTAFKMSVDDRLCAEGYGVYVGYDNEEQLAVPPGGIPLEA